MEMPVTETLELMKEIYGFQAYTLPTLIYSLGAGKGEIYPLVWQDIDFKNNIISISHKLLIFSYVPCSPEATISHSPLSLSRPT